MMTGKRNKFLPLLTMTASLALLGGCGIFGGDEEKPPLPGERISILDLQNTLAPDAEAASGFSMPAAWDNEFWPQAGGYPNHAMQHLALNGGELKPVWQASIGAGGTSRMPLTARPVVADGRVFALDTKNQVTALSAQDGKPLWKFDARPQGADESVIAGGLAFSGGVLYVAAGYNEIVAVNPANGEVYWRAAIDAPVRGAPTIDNGRVFAVTQTNTLVTLDARSGALLWDYSGFEGAASLVGGASPAADGGLVVPAFSSGEIYALRVENGSMAWSDNLASSLRLGGLSGIADIAGYPVIDKGMVFAISYAGRMVAIDAQTGMRVWTRDVGGSDTPWVAGNTVFVLSSEGELAAMARDTGAIRWVTQMARFADPDKRSQRLLWSGPVLAGGRLFVSGTGGRVAEIDPATGKPGAQWTVGKSLIGPPIVAGKTLYMLTEDGNLLAFR